MSAERRIMAENSPETTTTATEPITTSSQESGRPSVLERLKRFLGAIGKGASTAEEMGIYHPPEPPQITNQKTPVAKPSKP